MQNHLKFETAINKFRIALEQLDINEYLDGKALVVEPGRARLAVTGTKINLGATTSLPSGCTVGHLIEALRVGKATVAAVFEAVGKMASAFSRSDQRSAFDIAFHGLQDFTKIMIGVRQFQVELQNGPEVIFGNSSAGSFSGQAVVLGWQWVRNINEELDRFAKRMKRLPQYLQTVPLASEDMQLWFAKGGLDLEHAENKFRDDDYTVGFGEEVTPPDVVASIQEEPWAFILLLLLEMEDQNAFPQSVHVWKWKVCYCLQDSLEKYARQRLSIESGL